jgi:hypothetical protein
MVRHLVVLPQSSITIPLSRIVCHVGKGLDVFSLSFYNRLFWLRQIGGRQIGLFIYTLRQIQPGEELRYNYNHSETSIALWRPSPPGFSSRPEVLSFLADVKSVKVEKMPLESVSMCLELILRKIPGRFIVMSLQDCAQVAGFGENSGLRRFRNFLWMFTV